MTQKTEGIEASRLAAAEQSDGSLYVTLVIPSRGKAAFFSLFTELGAPLLLCPGQQPATQTVAPAGADMAGAMGAGEPVEITAILSDPRFQAWVEEQEANIDGLDAVSFARRWLERQASAAGSGYADYAVRDRVRAVLCKFKEWKDIKYGVDD